MSHTKSADGKYHIAGKAYPILIGTRAQVWHGTAYKTAGGLKKADLMQNKAGRIVSRAKHTTAKREMRLVKHGYGSKKGKFGYVKVGSKSRSRRSRKAARGGSGLASLSPADINESGVIGEIPQNFGPLERALVGGRRRSARRGRSARRRRSASQYGGMPYGSEIVPTNVGESNGINAVVDTVASTVGVQERAGMAGGRRRTRKYASMKAGTLNRTHAMGPGSVGVQFQAGLGN
jgi:hypothetical protein